MSLASMVLTELENVREVLKTCKEIIEEQEVIIKQLCGKPHEVEYIHPYDLVELLNSSNDVIDVWKNGDGSVFEIISTGKKYKQSILIPARTKKIV